MSNGTTKALMQKLIQAKRDRDDANAARDKANADFVDAVRRARRGGVSVADIAATADLSRQAIYDLIQEDRPVTYWLKMTGSGENPLDVGDWASPRRGWVRQYGEVSMFPRRPRIEPGDRLIDYAVGSQHAFGEGRIYASNEVVSEPEASRHERWRYQVETRSVVNGPLLQYCPTITDIDVDRRSIRRQSHIRLREDQGRRAEELLRKAAQLHGGLSP